MTPLKLARFSAVAGVCAFAVFVAAPSRGDPTISFVDCPSNAAPTPTPTPIGQPDITPPPTASPGATPPPAERTPPPQNCVPKQGDVIWGTRTLKFSVSPSSLERIDHVDISILANEDNLPDPNSGQPLRTWKYASNDNNAQNTQTYSFSWNSVVATPYNGKYKVRVDAVTIDATGAPHPSRAERTGLLVDNPPGPVNAPQVLSATYSNVTIQWDAAKERDVTLYTVYRTVTSSTKNKPSYDSLKPVGAVTGNAYRDGQVKSGTYWYSVIVTRRSLVTPDTGISSTMSAISSGAVVKNFQQTQVAQSSGTTPHRVIPFVRVTAPEQTNALANLPDAPFTYKLPYQNETEPGGTAPAAGATSRSEPGVDPRGPVLPVAVGAFLVSSALALGRMPY